MTPHCSTDQHLVCQGVSAIEDALGSERLVTLDHPVLIETRRTRRQRIGLDNFDQARTTRSMIIQPSHPHTHSSLHYRSFSPLQDLQEAYQLK